MGLSAEQLATYQRDGVVFPLDVWPWDEALALRRRVEAIEAAHGDGLAVADYPRGCAHAVLPAIDEAMRTPAILDAVESIIGPVNASATEHRTRSS